MTEALPIFLFLLLYSLSFSRYSLLHFFVAFFSYFLCIFIVITYNDLLSTYRCILFFYLIFFRMLILVSTTFIVAVIIIIVVVVLVVISAFLTSALTLLKHLNLDNRPLAFAFLVDSLSKSILFSSFYTFLLQFP